MGLGRIPNAADADGLGLIVLHARIRRMRRLILTQQHMIMLIAESTCPLERHVHSSLEFAVGRSVYSLSSLA